MFSAYRETTFVSKDKRWNGAAAKPFAWNEARRKVLINQVPDSSISILTCVRTTLGR
jgi:hypothetical protein